MTCYQHMDARKHSDLSPEHEEMLFKESAIDPDVAAERGVRTVSSGRDLPRSYSWRQKKRAPGILFTAHRPNGETATIFRPDTPDPKNPGHKYEQECKKLGGSGNVLDVLEHHRIGQRDTPVLFTEGVKKADSITSAARRARGSKTTRGATRGSKTTDHAAITVVLCRKARTRGRQTCSSARRTRRGKPDHAASIVAPGRGLGGVFNYHNLHRLYCIVRVGVYMR
jgi:hypothetical protein